jgi:hypothetical protein
MYSAAPVVNQGYYDVPICNQYSNKEVRHKPIPVNEYALNSDINLTINDNMGQYVVYQDPTVPSPSLYLEMDAPMAGYYYQDPMSLALDGTLPIVKKPYSSVYNYINSDLNPPFGMSEENNEMLNRSFNFESFENSMIHDKNNKNSLMKLIVVIILILILLNIFYYLCKS